MNKKCLALIEELVTGVRGVFPYLGQPDVVCGLVSALEIKRIAIEARIAMN